MPDLTKLTVLIDRLLQLSEEGKIAWSETAEERTFQATLAQYAVLVTSSHIVTTWGDDAVECSIFVHDKYGKLLEEGREGVLAEETTPSGEFGRVALRRLYELARRKALRVDQALDDLLGSLENL